MAQKSAAIRLFLSISYVVSVMVVITWSIVQSRVQVLQLPLMKRLSTICASVFHLLLQVFSERQQNELVLMHMVWQTFCEFIAILYKLSDVLPPLAQLSRAFQTKDIDFIMVQPLVVATKTTIRELIDCP